MLTIEPKSIADTRRLLEEQAKHLGDVWHELQRPHESAVEQDHPFVQLSSDEMAGEEIDQILGYEEIPRFDAPIGLPLDFEPIALGGRKILVFPLERLAESLRAADGGLVAELDDAGSMSAFIEKRKGEISAREYLIGGTWECIRYCRKRDHALEIRW